jgi:uncharacterized integral membrane protein
MWFVFWPVIGVLALLTASFVVSNRGTVEIGLWPLPDAYGVPLFAVVFAALLLGFLAGWSADWLRHGRVRAERRRHARRADALQAELDRKPAEPAKPESRALIG